jgi:hypothetical protein
VEQFLSKHADAVIGALSGFDRLVFRGTLRMLAHRTGMNGYLWRVQVLLKDFASHAEALTRQLRGASEELAKRTPSFGIPTDRRRSIGTFASVARPIRYQASGATNKEQIAREIARVDGIEQGLICILTAVEPCLSYEIVRDPNAKRRQLVPRHRASACFSTITRSTRCSASCTPVSRPGSRSLSRSASTAGSGWRDRMHLGPRPEGWTRRASATSTRWASARMCSRRDPPPSIHIRSRRACELADHCRRDRLLGWAFEHSPGTFGVCPRLIASRLEAGDTVLQHRVVQIGHARPDGVIEPLEPQIDLGGPLVQFGDGLAAALGPLLAAVGDGGEHFRQPLGP